MSTVKWIAERTPVHLALGLILLALLAPERRSVRADDAELRSLENSYKPEIQTLMTRYCNECHMGEKAEAELDLTAFGTFADVQKHSRHWQKIGEMLESGQMPPKDSRQPTPAERTQLQQWVKRFLTAEARARAGDPGRVVLRRLSNAEYTYTLRDLTGIRTLEPAKEFPVDGAAGEGFTNTGNALVMSPSLMTKYLDAAKQVASHAVLLPDGVRFSSGATRSDWTNETLAEIRDFYRTYTDPRGGDKVNLQGIVFETNEGGRLPVEKYLAATITEREALTKGTKSIAEVACEQHLNAKYLGLLWTSLNDTKPSLVLDTLRARWKSAKPEDVGALAADVAAWQKTLWKFNSVGHIGKVSGPKRWLDSINPLVTSQEIRFKIPAPTDGSDGVTLALLASNAGDGRDSDYVMWRQPRLVAPGRPDLLLRDVRALARSLAVRREELFSKSEKYLLAADEVAQSQGQADLAVVAKKHGIEVAPLKSWLDYLGVGSGGTVALSGHFTTPIPSTANYDFVKGWGSHETPLLVANSTDQHVRIPGNMKGHGVAVHPSPQLKAAVGWQSPLTSLMRIEGAVTHAHPECGNGVTWTLELRRGITRQRLASGVAQGNATAKFGPLNGVAVQSGDVVSLLIGPRDGNHSCDLTAIDLKLTSISDPKQVWDLAADVSPDILAGNPHADRQGNKAIWHFYTEAEKSGEAGPIIPAGSLLAKWQVSRDPAERGQLTLAVRDLLTLKTVPAENSPDDLLYRQLASLSGPLLSDLLKRPESVKPVEGSEKATNDKEIWGIDPALFGKLPESATKAGATNETVIEPASLVVQAPSVIEFRLPADLVAGCELVVTGELEQTSGKGGSVQLEVVAGKPAPITDLLPSAVQQTNANGTWTSNNQRNSFAIPILVREGSATRKRIEAAFDEFRQLFPAAICYTKIVPVDEVVTLTLFYREDDHLGRLMLDDAHKAQLDRLWDQLHYVSADALTLVDAFAQLMEYATQDADPKVFEPLRKPIQDRADAYRKHLIATEPKHLESILEIAGRAYRRPLEPAEAVELKTLYNRLRTQEIPHDEAIRLTLARVLVSPAFLYRIEKPQPGQVQQPINDFELASRLSYFLWSSQPDAELLRLAAEGQLTKTEVLVGQMKRMLKDDKTRRLAIEFACQWLHISDFDQLDEKSERHFPSFTGVRSAMYEESIRFFTDFFQNDGSVLGILDADHTFLNEELAKHYEIPGVSGTEWRKVENIKKFARGGILGQATTLTKQSGASRTSPILRGNWVSEVLLGERLPRPPKNVPQLPEDEAATEGLTVRQLTELHSSEPKCAVCHRRIDPMGFSLEGYDAIGRRREKDLANRVIDTKAKTMDGAEFEGLDGLRDYLLTKRRDAFLRQFCRKLLGYSLGRSVQLSDEPLMTELHAEMQAKEYRISAVLEKIVLSRQFREIRGRDVAIEE